uniref:Uncharacterized protein n=2 Tax=Zea mays TaxID=4577 RepID=A0A804PE03_MAIZE
MPCHAMPTSNLLYLSSSLAPAVAAPRQERAQELRATSRTRSPVSCTCPGRQSAGSTSPPARSHLPPTPAVTTRRSCSGPAGALEVRHVTMPRLRKGAMGRHDGGCACACESSTAAMSVCPPWYRKVMARCAGCRLPSSSMRTDRFLFLYSQGTAETASPPEVDLNHIATQAGQQLVIGRNARPGHHRSESLSGEHEPRPVGQAGYHDDLDGAGAAHPPVSAPQLQAGRCPYIIHLMNTHCG